jgi:glycerol-3-phosphate dehydrogenase
MQVDIPIAEAVYRILYERASADAELKNLSAQFR